jgi:FkbM family methyltransferase
VLASKWYMRLGIIFAKLIPSGMLVLILKGPLRGAKWIVGAKAGPAKGLSVVLNLLEPEQLDMARRLAPADGICFDIGASVGLYTLLFARYSGHVFAFEPLPRNVRYLSRTLEVNGVKNATLVPCAVSDSTGLLSFQEGENYDSGKLDSRGRQPVAAVSCDDFVSVYKVVPSILKIDVEGAEMSVLRGAENLLANHKPIILLSTHGEALRAGCLEFLKRMKYSQIVPLNNHKIDRASEFAIIP